MIKARKTPELFRTLFSLCPDDLKQDTATLLPVDQVVQKGKCLPGNTGSEKEISC